MPKPADTTEVDALLRVARQKLVDQINDSNIDAVVIVARLEVFIVAVIAQNIGDLAGRLVPT